MENWSILSYQNWILPSYQIQLFLFKFNSEQRSIEKQNKTIVKWRPEEKFKLEGMLW